MDFWNEKLVLRGRILLIKKGTLTIAYFTLGCISDKYEAISAINVFTGVNIQINEKEGKTDMCKAWDDYGKNV